MQSGGSLRPLAALDLGDSFSFPCLSPVHMRYPALYNAPVLADVALWYRLRATAVSCQCSMGKCMRYRRYKLPTTPKKTPSIARITSLAHLYIFVLHLSFTYLFIALRLCRTRPLPRHRSPSYWSLSLRRPFRVHVQTSAARPAIVRQDGDTGRGGRRWRLCRRLGLENFVCV